MKNVVKIFSFVVLATLMVISFSNTGLAGDEDAGEVKMQSICPIMGNPIDKEVFTDHDGKRVYFCCAGCIDTFNEDPATHISKMEKDGVTLAQTPDHDQAAGHDHDGEHEDHEGHDHHKGHKHGGGCGGH